MRACGRTACSTLAKKYGPWLIGAVRRSSWRHRRLAALARNYSVDAVARARRCDYAAAQQPAAARRSRPAPRRSSSASRAKARASIAPWRAWSTRRSSQTQGDLEAALAEFDAAAEAAHDPTMRDTAQLRAAYIAAETQDFAALRTRLQPLIDSDSRISYLAARIARRSKRGKRAISISRATRCKNSRSRSMRPKRCSSARKSPSRVIGPAPANTQRTARNAPAPSEGETK